MILYWIANALMFAVFTALTAWSYRRVSSTITENTFRAGKARKNIIIAHTTIYGIYIVLHIGLLFTSHG